MDTFNAVNFYNKISDKYHWFFSSWDNVMTKQADIITPYFKKYNVKSVLDCSCGSGLQAIALAKQGYSVDAGDISEKMILKAKALAQEQKIEVDFKVSDFRFLENNFNREYDAVISWGNSLPHLMNELDITTALKSIFCRLKSNGIALLNMRNYDMMLKEKNRFHPMRINDVKEGKRYSIIYVFDYLANVIRFNIIYLIEDMETGKRHMETESVDYNPITKTDLIFKLKNVGFRNVTTDENAGEITYLCEK